MSDLIEMGELLFDGVAKVSSYLFDTHFENYFISNTVSILKACQFEIFGVEFGPAEELIDFLDVFSSGSLASFLISGGIVAILGYRVVKFVLDIVL